MASSASPKRIAIVGSGVSGLATLWSLRNTNHEVHLYEAGDYVGGHTHTVPFKHGNGKLYMVDTGFIVCNSVTYPNFLAFLRHLKLPIIPTEMTFGVSRDYGAFEWSGTSPNAIFAQRENLYNPSMWMMLFDVIRFNIFAIDLLYEKPRTDSKGQPLEEETIGSYLDRHHYSEAFRDNYLIPMTACVWSTAPDKCSLDFPVVTLVRFLWNHHLLNTITERPTWLTIDGGSIQYVDKVLETIPMERVHLNTKITEVRNIKVPKDGDEEGTDIKVGVRFEGNDKGEVFDHVVLATHGDEALEILGKTVTHQEETILSNFKTSTNTAILHSDLSLMPKNELAWSSWNYLTTTQTSSTGPPPTVSLTYNMSHLQHLPSSPPILVTLNPPHEPAASTIQGKYTYSHPLYTPAVVIAQTKLDTIQNKPGRNISFIGAWTGYGFHEDGFKSGLKLGIEEFGGEGVPGVGWVDNKKIRGDVPPPRGSGIMVARVVITLMAWLIWILQVLYVQLGVGETRVVTVLKAKAKKTQ